MPGFIQTQIIMGYVTCQSTMEYIVVFIPIFIPKNGLAKGFAESGNDSQDR